MTQTHIHKICRSCQPYSLGELPRLGLGEVQKAFPGMSGFSRTNVYRMRAFYLAYQDAGQIVPQLVGQITDAGLPLAVAEIPWGHNVVLVEQIKDIRERLWYARSAIENGWSRSILVHWIERCIAINRAVQRDANAYHVGALREKATQPIAWVLRTA
jgi:hypothetical protein